MSKVKDRIFIASRDGEPGLNYLWPVSFKYFRHITPMMNRMAALLVQGRGVVEAVRTPPRQ